MMKNLDNIVTDLVLGHDRVWREPQANFDKNVKTLASPYKNPIIESIQSIQELLGRLKTNPIKISKDYFTENQKYYQDMIHHSLGLNNDLVDTATMGVYFLLNNTNK